MADKPPDACADVKISLTQNATKHSFPCYAVKNCRLMNDCNLLAGFSDFYLPLSHLTPSMWGIPSSCRVHIWYGKTRMVGLQSDEGRTMIDSVVWARYINVTDTQTATSPQQMSRQRTASGGKNKRVRANCD